MTKVSQKIGKRRPITAVQSRGITRREELIEAAIKLLKKKSIQDISFREIAKAAKVPEGSAYHFYANKYDLFAAVAEVMSELFYKAHAKKINRKKVNTWHDIIDVIVDRGYQVYKDNAVACELFIGTTAPPEIKVIDQQNDRKIATVMAEKFKDHFLLPDIPDFTNKIFYYIEIMDTLFSLSYRESGEISKEMIEEAKRVGKGYLATYLPPILPKVETT